MFHPHGHPVTRLITAAERGDSNAASQLLPLLYEELQKLARSLIRQRPAGQTLQATALVHEAYLRIVGKGKQDWDGRRQFFATAARAMQDILVESARRKAARKRGGDRQRVPLESDAVAVECRGQKLVEAEEILEKLERYDPRKCALVRLRYLVGLTVDESADVLGISRASAERELRFIRAWISRERGSRSSGNQRESRNS